MTDYFKKYPMENSKIIQLMRINTEPKTQSDQDPFTAYSAQSNKDPHEDSIPHKLR